MVTTAYDFCCVTSALTCFRTAPLGEESRPHPYLRAGLHSTFVGATFVGAEL
jgi:hypothetical protein